MINLIRFNFAALSLFAVIGNSHANPTEAEVAAAQLKNNSFIENHCSMKSKIFINVKEQIANYVKAHPDSLDLKRTEVTVREWGGRQIKSCVGYFYHANGVTKCPLQFDQSGTIANACNLLSTRAYSETLERAAVARTDAEMKEIDKNYQGITPGWKYDKFGKPAPPVGPDNF